MMTQDSTPLQAHRHARRPLPAPRREDHCPTRVIVGPPIGDGRVAYVNVLGAPRVPAPNPMHAPEVLLILHGHRPGDRGEEVLLRAAVRRCDLWNGDVDARFRALVLWTGWAVTSIERREIAPGSA